MIYNVCRGVFMYEEVKINSDRWFDDKLLLNEEWREYTYKDKTYYQVSNYGRVKSITRTRLLFNGVPCVQVGRILKARLVKNDTYISYCLSFDGKRKREYAHTLVARCFIPKNNFKYLETEDVSNIDYNSLEINHKDENGLNNMVDNLEWCTHTYNVNYGTRTKRVINATSKKIEQYDLNGNFIKEWNSLADASNYYGISRGTLCSCLKGDIKSSNGFQWKYKGSKEKINKYSSCVSPRKVIQLDLEGNFIARYDSLHDAERLTGVWMTQIRKCCNKTPMYNTAKGFKWLWEDEYIGK